MGLDGPYESCVRWGGGVAMATNFGTQFAMTGFVGYNVGCMTANDMMFDSRGGFFGVKLSDKDMAEIECHKGRYHRNHFWN